MNRILLITMIFIGLVVPASFVCADDEVKARIAASISQDHEIWAGQQLTVNLDLKTTGFSFSNSLFNLPEIDGAFLMQIDTTTIKLTERIDGETWQVIRYPLALYPQKAGTLEIPAIDARFSTSAGFGSTPKAFELRTDPIRIEVRLPPGAKEGAMLVSTASFKLDYNWQADLDNAKTGDAITLSVNRRATDISAMLLPPLPVYETEGLAAYPQAPEVNDRTNRGSLTGERVDSIIWVVEKPGSYAIPGIRFEWWDPDNHELKEQIIDGIRFEVSPAVNTDAGPVSEGKNNRSGAAYPWVLMFFAALLLILLIRHGRSWFNKTADSETTAFSALEKACRENNAQAAYPALHAWIAVSQTLTDDPMLPVTLQMFAQSRGDTRLGAGLATLQEAVVSPGMDWQGSELLALLRPHRQNARRRNTVRSNRPLAQLNP